MVENKKKPTAVGNNVVVKEDGPSNNDNSGYFIAEPQKPGTSGVVVSSTGLNGDKGIEVMAGTRVFFYKEFTRFDFEGEEYLAMDYSNIYAKE